jgi:hypothetical protein
VKPDVLAGPSTRLAEKLADVGCRWSRLGDVHIRAHILTRPLHVGSARPVGDHQLAIQIGQQLGRAERVAQLSWNATFAPEKGLARTIDPWERGLVTS